jgi:hypothetical protein
MLIRVFDHHSNHRLGTRRSDQATALAPKLTLNRFKCGMKRRMMLQLKT